MEKKNSHYIYILRCSDGTLYTGYTVDIEKRMALHESGKGAKYTRGRGPFELVYQEELPDKVSALRKEFQIKKLSRKKKKELIRRLEERKSPIEDAEKFSAGDE